MRLVKALIKIALSAALIAIVIHAFDVKGVGAHFLRVDAATLLTVIAVALAVAPLHALRWLAVIGASGNQLRFGTALEVVLIGHFFNQVLPSSVGGDAMRVWCAYRTGFRFGDAAATVIIDRLLTLLSLLLLAAVGLPGLFEIVGDPVARWALSTVICAGLVGFVVFIAIVRLPGFAVRWRALRALLDVTALARKVVCQPRYALPVILLSVASFAGFAFIVFSLARAIQLDVTFVECMLLVPPVILVTIVPVSIAGWGVREGAMVVAFGFLNVPASAAFAVSVLFGLTLAVASLPGSLLWWLGGYSARNAAAHPSDS